MQAVTAGFDVRVDVIGTTRTIAVAGEIDLAVTDELEAVISGVVNQQPEAVVLDLSDVGFIDSTGISVVMGATRHALARGVRLVIIPGPPCVQRVFEICDLEASLPFVS